MFVFVDTNIFYFFIKIIGLSRTLWILGQVLGWTWEIYQGKQRWDNSQLLNMLVMFPVMARNITKPVNAFVTVHVSIFLEWILKSCPVPDSVQLGWAFPGNRSVWLSSVPDSAKYDSSLSLTALDMTHHCPRLHSTWLTTVPDSARHDSSLSLTALDMTHHCPGSTWLITVPDCTRHDSPLSRTALDLTQRSPWQCSVWLITIQYWVRGHNRNN